MIAFQCLFIAAHGSINVPKIIDWMRAIRCHSYRFQAALLGFVQVVDPPDFDKNLAKIRIAHGVVRVKFQGLAKQQCRFFELSLFLKNHTKVNQRHGELRS